MGNYLCSVNYSFYAISTDYDESLRLCDLSVTWQCLSGSGNPPQRICLVSGARYAWSPNQNLQPCTLSAEDVKGDIGWLLLLAVVDLFSIISLAAVGVNHSVGVLSVTLLFFGSSASSYIYLSSSSLPSEFG